MKTKFPGWRTMTAAQRYNAKMHAIFDAAKAQGHTGFRSMTVCAREIKPGDTLEEFGLVDFVEVTDSNIQIGYAKDGNWGDFAPDSKIVRMNKESP